MLCGAPGAYAASVSLNGGPAQTWPVGDYPQTSSLVLTNPSTGARIEFSIGVTGRLLAGAFCEGAIGNCQFTTCSN